jgi:hypothetical protein
MESNHIETAILIKDVPYRDTPAHFTYIPVTTKFCFTSSSPILSFHPRTLTAQTAVINNIRFAAQG